MSMTYELLSKEQAVHLRRQRLLDLEADHWRYAMDLEEADPNSPEYMKTATAIQEVERRIALHRKALSEAENDAPETDSDADGAG